MNEIRAGRADSHGLEAAASQRLRPDTWRAPALGVRCLALLALVLVGHAAHAVPRFTSTPVTAVNEDSAYGYDIRTADNQSGRRQITAPVLPTWLRLTNVSLDGGSARLTGTPTQAQVGTHEVTLQVTNLSRGTTALQSFAITVVNVNDAPVITGQTPNPIPLARSASLTIQLGHLTVVDVDDVYPTDFSLSVLNGSSYTRVGNTITPGANFTGMLSVPVRVNDGVVNSNTFNVRVEVSDRNSPPEIVAPIPDQLATENAPFRLSSGGAPTTLAAFFRDPDAGDVLRYEVTGLPPSGNLVANATTGEITGTPLAVDTRDTPYVVDVVATDGRSPPSELPRQSFELTIAALDRADLALSVAVAPAPALTNGAVDWTFAIANAGPQPSVPVELAAEFAGNPFSFTALSSCVVTPNADRQQLTCSVPTIAAGATTTIKVSGRAVQGGDILATSTVGGSTLRDPNPGNNGASTTLHVAQVLSSGPAQSLPSPNSEGAATGDVNGDGFADVVLAKGVGGGVELYLNVADAANTMQRRLADVPVVIGDSPAADLALADLDGDSDLDLVTADASGKTNNVYLNDGARNFTLLAALNGGASTAVAVADFDADGRRDLAFANSGPGTVYLNQSGGTFTLAATLASAASRGVVAIDLDLDNLPDLVFASPDGPSRYFRNLGAGAFAAGVAIDARGAASVAGGDFNNDGRTDLVFARPAVASGLPSNPVYQNNPGVGSSPVFVLIAGLGAAPTVEVLAADVDGDGASDIVAINSTGTHQVYRGNGAGGFALHPVQFSIAAAKQAALGRLSADTRVDLVVAGALGSGVFHNDGRGGFGLGDTTLPVIQLLGAASVTVQAGAAYQDSGATATDDVDGTLTSGIVIENPVNTAIVGDYDVTYNVRDSFGNAAVEVTRNVRVAAREGTGGGGGGAAGPSFLALLGVMLYIARRRRRPS